MRLPALLEMDPPSPAGPHMAAASADTLTATLERPGARTIQLIYPEVLTHSNHEIISVCCLKPLSFRIISYAAIGN